MVRCRSPVLPRLTAVTLGILATPMPQQRLPFVQISLLRDSPISDDFLEPSSQELQSPNKAQTSQRQSP
jgi:hypothetical protein